MRDGSGSPSCSLGEVKVDDMKLKDLKDDERTNVANFVDNQPFIWLAPWIQYLPTVITTKWDNDKVKQRNNLISCIYISVATIVTIGECLWYSITPFMDYFQDDWLYPIVHCIAMLLITAAKLISLYYFWSYFDFKILCSCSLNLNQKSGDLKNISTLSNLNDIIRNTNRRMKLILAVLIIFIFGLCCIKITNIFVEDEGIDGWFGFIRSILYYVFFDVPIFLHQFILSIYYLKGYLFVSGLKERVQSQNIQNIDLKKICNEYKAFRDLFRKQIYLSELMIKCRICALIPWVWIDITYVVESENYMDGIEECIYLFMSCLPIIELVLSGSSATTQYYKFKDTLFEIKELSLESLYLLDYVCQYPFLVKIFAKEVSIKNALKVAAAFIAAKAITYLFRRTTY